MKDFTDEPWPAYLLALEEAGKLPDYVKQASLPSAEDLAGLSSFVFGDQIGRKFPLHDKTAAYLSALSFVRSGGALESREGLRIKTACDAYGCLEDVEAAIQLLTPPADSGDMEKEASPSAGSWALSLELPSGESAFWYPIGNADECEESAAKLAADIHENRLPGSWFAGACQKLVKAAKDFGLPLNYLPAEIRELAEERFPDRAYAEKQIALRKQASDMSPEEETFYKEALELAINEPEHALEASHAWELLDRRLGIKYAGTLKDPVRALQGGALLDLLRKEAADRCLIEGVLVPSAVLRTLPEFRVASVFPEDSARRILAAKRASDATAMTAELSNLPQVDRRHLLRELLSHAG